MTTATAPALPDVLLPGRLFIDGEWQDAESTEIHGDADEQ